MYVTYVLRLEDRCFYVGKTTHLKHRLLKHWTSDGCTWTRIHKPVELMGVLTGDREASVTAEMISIYGERYVRGNHYSSIGRKDTSKFMETHGYCYGSIIDMISP